METFWSQGYEATSLQDLLAAMSLSKSSLYQSFGDKPRLFDRCLRHYARERESALLESLEASDSARDFIETTFRNAAEGTDSERSRWGCLLMNTASEFGLRDTRVSQAVAEGVARFTRVFRTAVERAQAEGDVPADRDPQALARYLVTNMTGLRTLLKTGSGRDEARAVVAITLRALD